jgi:hypothetical protein
MTDRRQESYAVRLEAAELARSRAHPVHKANGEEQRYAGDRYFMSFTKGLPHHPDTGLLQDPQDFQEFRRAIDEGFVDPFSDRVRHGARYEVKGNSVVEVPKVDRTDNFRQWEAPTAGTVYELEGADAQAVTMPPAPPLLLGPDKLNPELALEMAEVYELAVLRDIPFNAFEGTYNASDPNSVAVQRSIERLNALDYIKNHPDGKHPGRPRKVEKPPGASGTSSTYVLGFQTAFRGASPGVDVGPYLSQFLLIGNVDHNKGGSVADGIIRYGVLDVSQKVPIATPKKDYMVTMSEYVAVQRGLRPDPEMYLTPASASGSPPQRPLRRFITTPRDLATYVHHDALYEAYLNACLILLAMGTPSDPAFDQLSGVGVAAATAETRRQAAGFALWGGPHILTLVTEVATRALKAVRYQKFNNHLRLRPEALAARIELRRSMDLPDTDSDHVDDSLVPGVLKDHIGGLLTALTSNTDSTGVSTLAAVQAGTGDGRYFLPMAFPEGSPMHPSYGAGHATVAGACVTILKAFFDTSTVLVRTPADPSRNRIESFAFKRPDPQIGDEAVAFRAPPLGAGSAGVAPPDPLEWNPSTPLTLEGELNKLAANISIGRDMAGVHFFTDYYDSVRMGEAIALSILEEQALTYLTDPCVFSVPTFDGSVVRIGRR